jgi:hypothetical protein
LGGGILASNAIRSELEVGLASHDFLLVGIVEMRVEDLLGVRQRAAIEAPAHNLQILGHFLIVNKIALLPVILLNPLVERGDGGQISPSYS